MRGSARVSAGPYVGVAVPPAVPPSSHKCASRGRIPPYERSYVLEAPVCDGLATFHGHPPVSGEVMWSTPDRCATVRGEDGEMPFGEIVA